MNKLLRVFFIAALVVGSPANLVFALAGTEYYVDTSAAAGGDGSSTLPWATISDAVESGQLADGDTVHIATGIYDTESFPVNLVPGVSYIGAGASTEIQVPSSPLGSSAILHLTTQPGASNTTLSNVSLDGMAENGLSVFGSQSATTSIVVDHVTFNGIGDGNMVRVNTDNVLANLTISNCDVTDANILELSMAMGTASLSGTQVISVNDNTVNNASFDAIDIQNLRDMNCDVTISGNVGNVIGDNPIVLNLYNTPIADVTIDNNSWDLADDEVIDAVFQQYEDLNLNINNNTATNSNDDGFTISLSAYSG